MCGIAGIVAPQLDQTVRESALARMIDRQQHRGPDDRGVISHASASLGMARLAIIDPAHGHQPMTSPDGRFHLVFNGAIYNHRELRASLEPEWTFRTQCDTEVLLAAFVRYGANCLEKLRGMFAFAVWDTFEQTLFAARDGLGIKPFYYARRADRSLVFASELNALFASRLIDREIDATSVGEYLAWFSVPAPRTLYRGVVNLPPGHLLKLDRDGRLSTEAWWRLPAHQRPYDVARDYAGFIHGLREQLDDTIRAHRVADVPVGAFLSGGMDSTAVAGLMIRSGATGLKTFSIGFEEAGYAEQANAREAARLLGTEHHEEILTGTRVAADMPRILAAFDQPTGDGINTYYASALAARHGVKVALSGLGGDELFGGYPSFRDLPRLQRLLPWWRRLPGGVRQRIVTKLRTRPEARARKLADFFSNARDLHELASLQRRVLPEVTRLALLSTDARALANRLGPHHPLLENFAFELAGADDFQIVSAWELRTYMANVLLRDSDVMSMANSLELRVPFVDTRLVEWLWPQPDYFKRDPRLTKRVLADAVADVVPLSIRRRPKQGFTLPFPLWMKKELRPFLEDTFAPSALSKCPWLDAPTVSRLWTDFQKGTDNRSWSRVWTVAMLVAFANRRNEY